MIEGVTCIIQTDHRHHISAFTKTGDAWSVMQQRQLSAIAEPGGLSSYIPCTKNPIADALSRVTINDVHIVSDYQALAREQQQDPDTYTYKTAVTNLK